MNGGIFRIDKLVQDGVSKSAMARLHRYIVLSDVRGVPDFAAIAPKDGSIGLLATQCWPNIRTEHFSRLRPLSVATAENPTLPDADNPDEEIRFTLIEGQYAREAEDQDADGKFIYHYVASADIPRGVTRAQYLRDAGFTAPDKTSLFRHEEGYVSGSRTKVLRPPVSPSDDADAEPKKKKSPASPRKPKVRFLPTRLCF